MAMASAKMINADAGIEAQRLRAVKQKQRALLIKKDGYKGALPIYIGNHVWIGAWARLCKDVYIPDGCIIGMGSIVTKKFTKKNSIIAGNPAKVVKEDVNWVRESPNFYRRG